MGCSPKVSSCKPKTRARDNLNQQDIKDFSWAETNITYTCHIDFPPTENIKDWNPKTTLV